MVLRHGWATKVCLLLPRKLVHEYAGVFNIDALHNRRFPMQMAESWRVLHYGSNFMRDDAIEGLQMRRGVEGGVRR